MLAKLLIGAIVASGLITATYVFEPLAALSQKRQNDDATPVQRGLVTEKERVYSKEYEKQNPLWRGRKFGDLILESESRGESTGDIGGYLGPREQFSMPDAPAVTAGEFFSKLSCKSDAVVIGSILGRKAHMSIDETFIYTEYEIAVKTILKNNSSSPFSTQNSIEITRPGGLIKLDNRRVKIDDHSFPALQKDKTYLLFLRYVPLANGYMPSGSEGDFIVENNSYRKLAPTSVPIGLTGNNPPQELLSSIRAGILAGCAEQRKGGN